MVDNLDRREISADEVRARPGRCCVTDDAARARQELALLLRRLNVELDAVGQRFAEVHGLNRTDVRALVAIMDAARRGEALTAGRLGEAVDLRSASVTALVDRLEKVGHVRRGRDPGDRRRGRLEVAEAAMAGRGAASAWRCRSRRWRPAPSTSAGWRGTCRRRWRTTRTRSWPSSAAGSRT